MRRASGIVSGSVATVVFRVVIEAMLRVGVC
jgi:hypothetical protein